MTVPFTQILYNDPSVFDLNETEVVYQDLKLDDVPVHIINSEGKVLNIDQAYELEFKTFFDLYEIINNGFISQHQYPYIAIQAEGSFTHLDYIHYNDDTRTWLNKQGLHIFIVEIPTLTDQVNLNQSLPDYIHLSNKNISTEFSYYKPSLIGFNSSKNIKCFEFDKIQDFVTRNNLNNVHVYTGYYNIKEHFNYSFEIHTLDIVLSAISKEGNSNKFHEVNYNSAVGPLENIEYKFVCPTRKYIGVRELLASYLYSESAQVSYMHKLVDFDVILDETFVAGRDWEFYWEDIDRRLPFKFSEWQTKYPTYYNTIIKNFDNIKNNLYIDREHDHNWSEIADINLIVSDIPIEQYKKSFLYVVSESVFAVPFGYACDKTLTAIKCMRPFVLVSPPHSLEYLHAMGFKTFGEYWDESYDQETDHEKRFIKVLDIIKKISTMSIQECQNMCKDMESILLHNNKNIVNMLSFKKY